MSNTLRSLNHLLVILTFAASIWAWINLPELERYPIHWNAAGEADGFSSKWGVFFVLSIFPLTAISTHLFLWFLPKIQSVREAVEESGIVYDITWHCCLWLYLVMNGVIALIYMSLLKGDATSFDSDLMMRVMPAALGLLYIVLGNVMGKARQNKYVGVKTPWTLKSKSTWDATEAQGVKEIYIDDLREEFVRDFVFPMFRANALYEGLYLLGTSIARPLISKRQIEIAHEVGADAPRVCLSAHSFSRGRARQSDLY